MRSVYEVATDIAAYAPNGGDTWQNVGMRQVPVRLLTELREAVEREQRVKVAWQASERDVEPFYHPGLLRTQEQVREACQRRAEYAGAWKFDEPGYMTWDWWRSNG